MSFRQRCGLALAFIAVLSFILTMYDMNSGVVDEQAIIEVSEFVGTSLPKIGVLILFIVGMVVFVLPEDDEQP